MNPRASCLLGNCSTSELHPQPIHLVSFAINIQMWEFLNKKKEIMGRWIHHMTWIFLQERKLKWGSLMDLVPFLGWSPLFNPYKQGRAVIISSKELDMDCPTLRNSTKERKSGKN